jgi:predicted  nucleic acid-binding Zn-ribbon protein
VTLKCLRCGEPYEQKRRQASHFCPTCREANKRERDSQRQRENRALKREMLDQLDAWVQHGGMSDDYAANLEPCIDDYVTQQKSGDSRFDAVPDRMPTGANSPAGPDEGCSTGWSDLAETLDQQARRAAEHQWFADNPHWAFALHDDIDIGTIRTAA